jgi:glycerol-3-phosphate acyltransferase PlsX
MSFALLVVHMVTALHTDPTKNLKHPEMLLTHIGIDLMGSESSPLGLLQSIVEKSHVFPLHVKIHLYLGDSLKSKAKEIFNHTERKNLFETKYCSEVIFQTEIPVRAVRSKPDSSLVVGLKELQKGVTSGFITLGNTGALIAATKFILSCLPGIKRPSLIASLPTRKRKMFVADVGGNLNCKSDHLKQFCLTAISYALTEKKEGQELTAGLLNIGSEESKGSLIHQEALKKIETLCRQLEKKSIYVKFLGNVEPREAFQGKVDILVTDGFSGNIFLKTSEGMAEFIFDALATRVKDSKENLLRKEISSLKPVFDYGEHPGAFVGGVTGLVMKCHGSSPTKALIQGIKTMVKDKKRGLLEQLKKTLEACNEF